MGKEMDLDLSSLAANMMGGGIKESSTSGNNKKKKYARPDNSRKEGTNSLENIENAESYVGTPYNFVSFSDKVFEYPKEKLMAHNIITEDGITGEITYEVTAKTPIFIGSGRKDANGTEDFYKDARGNFAIPGSTIRGLIRNNVQILGLSGFYDDIDDYALMYRNVAEKRKKTYDDYKTILDAKQIPINNGKKNVQVGILRNVKAGYIIKENGKYFIYQTDVDNISSNYGEMNYYVLSERKVIEDYLKDKKNFSYEFFREEFELQHEWKHFEKNVRNGQVHYRGTSNKKYKPDYKEISYEVVNKKDITAVGKPGKYKYEGYVISSGYMNEKKAIYIIPKLNREKSPIPISQDDLKAFNVDFNKRSNQLGDVKDFFDLPKEEGKIKPVFYVQLGERLYFGFTPRLRLFYDNKIKEGLYSCHQESILDYAKAMFGYANKQSSYKSRISFSDAVADDIRNSASSVDVLLAEPKPTSFLDYLKPDAKHQGMTYNMDGFELRGVKQYWLKGATVPCKIEETQKKVASSMKPLPSGTKFTGKIRFQNLTQEELGLLLWGIRLESDSWMNVGKAKAYGYGNIAVSITNVQKINQEKAYCPEKGLLNLQPFEEVNVNQMIQCYKNSINKFLGKVEIDKLPHIIEFFAMKDSTVMPDKEDTRYMSLTEYQKRKGRVLDDVHEVIQKTKEKKK